MPVDPTEDPALKEFWERVDVHVEPDVVVAEAKDIAEAQREVWGPCMAGTVDLHKPEREELTSIVRCVKCGEDLE